jgi:hypothetical protein
MRLNGLRHLSLRLALSALALALAMPIGLASAAPPADVAAKVQAHVAEHPEKLYAFASALSAQGRKRDAAFVFFLAQLRWRAHLAARNDAEAAEASLAFEKATKPLVGVINKPIVDDHELIDGILADVIAFDRENPDRFTDPAKFPDVWTKTRGELMSFRQIMQEERQRKEIERQAMQSP